MKGRRTAKNCRELQAVEVYEPEFNPLSQHHLHCLISLDPLQISAPCYKIRYKVCYKTG